MQVRSLPPAISPKWHFRKAQNTLAHVIGTGKLSARTFLCRMNMNSLKLKTYRGQCILDVEVTEHIKASTNLDAGTLNPRNMPERVRQENAEMQPVQVRYPTKFKYTA